MIRYPVYQMLGSSSRQCLCHQSETVCMCRTALHQLPYDSTQADCRKSRRFFLIRRYKFVPNKRTLICHNSAPSDNSRRITFELSLRPFRAVGLQRMVSRQTLILRNGYCDARSTLPWEIRKQSYSRRGA